MTPEQHRQRHKELHQALDELFADYIRCNPDHSGSFIDMPLRTLLDWSYQQTVEPDQPSDLYPHEED